MNDQQPWKKTVTLLGTLSLATLMLCAQPSTNRESAELEKEFQAAMAAEDQGDLHRAESLLLALRAKHPGIFAVDESLGLLFVRQEKYAEALPVLMAAVHEEPSSDVAHANLGAAYFKLHRNPEALAELQRAARINARNAATQQALGELWMNTQQPKRAAEAFAAALAIDPNNVDVQLENAQAWMDAGEAGKASAILAHLSDADRSATAQTLLAEIDEKAGAFQKAAQHYAHAVELDPSESRVWMLGVEFLRHWTFDAAITEFESATTKFPESLRMRLGLGAAYFGNGNYAKAIPVFADLLQADVDNALYAELLGMSCTAVMQGEKSRCSALLRYAQAHPKDAKAAIQAASTLVTDGASEEDTAMAQRLLQSAIATDPKLTEAYYQLGVLKQNQADWAGSISPLETAIALKPNDAQAHYRLSLAYWRCGRKPEAQAEMELQKKFSRQQQQDLDQRLRQITTFLVNVHGNN